MPEKKAFDCVDMKNQIQAQHAVEYAGLSDEERWALVAHKLATSDDAIARKWREITALAESKKGKS